MTNLKMKCGLNFFMLDSRPYHRRTCLGWDPRHQMCWDPIAKYISNPDFGCIVFAEEGAMQLLCFERGRCYCYALKGGTMLLLCFERGSDATVMLWDWTHTPSLIFLKRCGT